MSGPPEVDDLTVTVAGQGGDGSLTLTRLLAGVFASRGLHLYETRTVGSRIKGGHAAASLRASVRPRGCMRRTIDILVAFDAEAVSRLGHLASRGGVVVFDSSDGPLEARPHVAEVIEIPLGRSAVRDLRRDLFKNSFAFGILAGLLGVEATEAAQALRRRLDRLPDGLIEANVSSMAAGLDHLASEVSRGSTPRFVLPPVVPARRVLISGNEAAAMGFLVAGGRFFAGYPITPATEILEWLEPRLPEFGGIVVQAEDELAAINMAMGAALTGVRAMTATSGPGVALMQEGVGHLASAEIGVVIVNCQRSGPSTGMPTKPEQSDIHAMVHGASGDVAPIVLAPADPADAFELTRLAVDIAEAYQGPVFVALDQVVAQDAATVEPFEVGGTVPDRGARLTRSDLDAIGRYRRYEITADGISPWVPPGTPGTPYLVTGNEHDEWGRVSADPSNRVDMVHKRSRKLETIRPRLPTGRRLGTDAAIGVLGFGMEVPVMREAAEILRRRGVAIDVLQVRTISPVLQDTLDFIASHDRVHVVEHNSGGQYASILVAAGASPDRLDRILRYDGTPNTPEDLVERILDRTGLRA